MANSPDLASSYRQRIAKVQTQIRSLESMRAKLVWLLVGGVALTPVALFLVGFWGLLMALAGSSFYVVGHYLAWTHLREEHELIESMTQVLAELSPPAALRS